VTPCCFDPKSNKSYALDRCNPADWTDASHNAADIFVEEIFREEVEKEQDSVSIKLDSCINF